MIWLIDGRSGAGKTTVATMMAQDLGCALVHCDDFYPGWDGLAAAGDIIADSILADRPPRGYPTFDWQRQVVSGWYELEWEPGADLIIEGCGALSQRSYTQAAQLDQVRSVYIDADPHWRQVRAFARDDNFAPFWQRWAQQELLHQQRMPRPDISVWVKSGAAQSGPIAVPGIKTLCVEQDCVVEVLSVDCSQ